jgi:hypothetical protein
MKLPVCNDVDGYAYSDKDDPQEFPQWRDDDRSRESEMQNDHCKDGDQQICWRQEFCGFHDIFPAMLWI